MISISSKLSLQLKTELKNADEIWIAVGLLNIRGLQYILNSINKTCTLNFVVGIDLPTDPKALSKLLSLKTKRTVTAKILTQDFFHPKVYIIKSGKQFTALVGSANCTMGGLEDNIEMSLVTKDQAVCKKLKEWFAKNLLENSQVLTIEFIRDYKPKYDRRIKRRKKEKEEIAELKKKEQTKFYANLKARKKFILTLNKIKKSGEYEQNRKDRQATIKALRKCLDYPNFKKVDLKQFFSIKELGTIVPIKVKGSILVNPKKFTELMRFICNEEIELKTRIDDALRGRLSLDGIGKGFISKVLVTHNPRKYYLHNEVFTERLKPFGLALPRGLSFGEKYELTLNILNEIMKVTNIDDFATLDLCIWSIKDS